MAELYTRQLFYGTVPVGLTFLSAPPAGEVWVVRDCRVEQLGGEDYAAVYVYDGSNFCPVVVNYPPTGSGFFYAHEPYTVVEYGQSLLAEGDVYGLSIIISGYRFVLP